LTAATYPVRIDPDYCRGKAAQCRELARKATKRSHAKMLLKLAARFDAQASWPGE
jgi:hypothetical protein